MKSQKFKDTEKYKEQKRCHNCYQTITDRESKNLKHACEDCAELWDSILRAKYEYVNLALEMGRLLSIINKRQNKYDFKKFKKERK